MIIRLTRLADLPKDKKFRPVEKCPTLSQARATARDVSISLYYFSRGKRPPLMFTYTPTPLVRPAYLDPEHSVDLFDANRLNDDDEMYCVAPAILPAQVDQYWELYVRFPNANIGSEGSAEEAIETRPDFDRIQPAEPTIAPSPASAPESTPDFPCLEDEMIVSAIENPAVTTAAPAMPEYCQKGQELRRKWTSRVKAARYHNWQAAFYSPSLSGFKTHVRKCPTCLIAYAARHARGGEA